MFSLTGCSKHAKNENINSFQATSIAELSILLMHFLERLLTKIKIFFFSFSDFFFFIFTQTFLLTRIPFYAKLLFQFKLNLAMQKKLIHKNLRLIIL